MKPGHDNIIRDSFGVIVTLENRATRERLTRTEHGFVYEALTAVLVPFDPAEWRVLAISTPRTILGDLRGRKMGLRQQVSRDRQFSGSTSETITSPERVLLGAVKQKAFL